MIKRTVCILLLLAAIAAVVVATLDRENTHTLLPLPQQRCTTTEEPQTVDSLQVTATDSLQVMQTMGE